MGSGLLTHIGVAKEVAWGTPIAATDYLKFNSENMALVIEENLSAQLHARRDEPESYEGLGRVMGDTVHEVHPNGLGYILRSWFGQPVTTKPGTLAYQHVFTPYSHFIPAAQKGTATGGSTTTLADTGKTWVADAYIGMWVHVLSGTGAGQVGYITDNDATTLTVATWTPPSTDSVYEIRVGPGNCILPPYTLEINRDIGSPNGFQYSGCVANVLAFSYGVAAKILNLTTSWIGKDEAKLANTTPTLETTKPFTWDEAVIQIGGSAYNYLETLSFNLNNGLVGIPLLNASPKRIGMIQGDTYRTGTIAPTFRTQDRTEYDKYKGWTTAAWTITFTSGLIEAGKTYTLTISFPKVLYMTYPIGIAGPGQIIVGATGKIKYDNSSGYLCMITLQNSIVKYS